MVDLLLLDFAGGRTHWSLFPCFPYAWAFDGTPKSNFIQFAILGLFILILVGSGIFASVLKITAENGRESVTTRLVAFKTLIFCLLQILVAPLVVASIVLGCSAVSSV